MWRKPSRRYVPPIDQALRGLTGPASVKGSLRAPASTRACPVSDGQIHIGKRTGGEEFELGGLRRHVARQTRCQSEQCRNERVGGGWRAVVRKRHVKWDRGPVESEPHPPLKQSAHSVELLGELVWRQGGERGNQFGVIGTLGRAQRQGIQIHDEIGLERPIGAKHDGGVRESERMRDSATLVMPR